MIHKEIFFVKHKVNGSAETLCVQLQILLLVILLLSSATFIGAVYHWTAIVFGLYACGGILLGFYGTVSLQPNILFFFVLFTSFQIMLAIIFGMLTFISLAANTKINPYATATFHILLILYFLNTGLSIISMFWAQKLRHHISEPNFSL
eukprot:Phypoly_transcript_17440.p1 GENE.Phypoly_transcript_17440~~Phypoly_transcript_17440.p1  ORF type:complete len:149 (-),score=11.93 Phypoly_transcript_17440:286-732(-)